ncbi:MAG: hypothetical protein ABW007_20130 [Chitinophagaceae bacterium]
MKETLRNEDVAIDNLSGMIWADRISAKSGKYLSRDQDPSGKYIY